MPKDCKDCKICRINNLLVLKCNPAKPAIKPIKAKHPSRDINMEETYTDNRTLRVVTVLAWIPAFSLLLPHAIRSEDAFPAVGLIPMTLSVCFGLLRLAGRPRSRMANVVVDLFLAIFLISMLIPSWVMMAEDWGSSGLTMLGTYGTTALMINFCIHSWFVLSQVPFSSLLSSKRSGVCPHCNGDLRQRGPPSMGRASSQHSHESYVSVQQVDPIVMEEGRASGPEKDGRSSFHDDVIDETAPLM